jgi:hypothetical protein
MRGGCLPKYVTCLFPRKFINVLDAAGSSMQTYVSTGVPPVNTIGLTA